MATLSGARGGECKAGKETCLRFSVAAVNSEWGEFPFPRGQGVGVGTDTLRASLPSDPKNSQPPLFVTSFGNFPFPPMPFQGTAV